MKQDHQITLNTDQAPHQFITVLRSFDYFTVSNIQQENEVAFAQLSNQAQSLRLQSGQYLFRQGDPAEYVYVLLKGGAQAIEENNNSQESEKKIPSDPLLVIAQKSIKRERSRGVDSNFDIKQEQRNKNFKEGDLIGEISFLEMEERYNSSRKINRKYSVQCVSDCLIMRISLIQIQLILHQKIIKTGFIFFAFNRYTLNLSVEMHSCIFNQLFEQIFITQDKPILINNKSKYLYLLYKGELNYQCNHINLLQIIPGKLSFHFMQCIIFPLGEIFGLENDLGNKDDSPQIEYSVVPCSDAEQIVFQIDKSILHQEKHKFGCLILYKMVHIRLEQLNQLIHLNLKQLQFSKQDSKESAPQSNHTLLPHTNNNSIIQSSRSLSELPQETNQSQIIKRKQFVSQSQSFNTTNSEENKNLSQHSNRQGKYFDFHIRHSLESLITEKQNINKIIKQSSNYDVNQARAILEHQKFSCNKDNYGNNNDNNHHNHNHNSNNNNNSNNNHTSYNNNYNNQQNWNKDSKDNELRSAQMLYFPNFKPQSLSLYEKQQQRKIIKCQNEQYNINPADQELYFSFKQSPAKPNKQQTSNTLKQSSTENIFDPYLLQDYDKFSKRQSHHLLQNHQQDCLKQKKMTQSHSADRIVPITIKTDFNQRGNAASSIKLVNKKTMKKGKSSKQHQTPKELPIILFEQI